MADNFGAACKPKLATQKLETIEPYVTQLREEGWCVLDNVISS